MTSGSYRPDQREVFSHCWTEGSWIPGGLCVPAKRGLQDHLNQKEPFLKLRNAVISAGKDPLPFLALRRDRVAMIVPPETEQADGGGASSTQHRIVCLLKGAILTGTLFTLASMRVSDFLMRAPGFIAVNRCKIVLGGRPDLPFPNPAPLVFVNAERVIGIAEL